MQGVKLLKKPPPKLNISNENVYPKKVYGANKQNYTKKYIKKNLSVDTLTAIEKTYNSSPFYSLKTSEIMKNITEKAINMESENCFHYPINYCNDGEVLFSY